MIIFYVGIACLYGLLFGSFLNVVIWRIPIGQTITQPKRSYCPKCNTTLSPLELIPVFSWLFLAAKCKNCKEKISARYPIVELLTSLLFGATVYFIHPVILGGYTCILVCLLICITFVDIDTQTIPDIFNAMMLVSGVGYIALKIFYIFQDPHTNCTIEHIPHIVETWDWLSVILSGVAGGIIGGGLLWLVDFICVATIKKDAFGGGDVKMMLGAGLFLGWKLTIIALILSFFLGGIWGIFLIITKKAAKGTYFAFGPYLAAAVWISLCFGEKISSWYLAMFSF